MKRFYNLHQWLITLCLVAAIPFQGLATNYYVSDNSGSDSNNGTTPSTPWKTLSKVSSTNFSPGDSILFKAGETWIGQLIISSSGTAGNPIIYGKYGAGALPYLASQGGAKATITSLNKQYFELTYLKVTNFLQGNSINDEDDSLLLAMDIVNFDAGTLNHIYLTGMEITKVNSQHESSGSIYYGGVRFDIQGTTTPSKWNDIIVSGCNFHEISRTGITFRSEWETRSSTSTFGQTHPTLGYTDNWVPSTNIILRDNIFKKITGNGLVIRVATGALIENNLFDSCAYQISGNATFCFNTDGTIFQFNEAKNTIYNSGDTDARGIDADYRTKNTVIQYNYLHDNGRGGIVATGGNENGTTVERFNKGTLVRYNVLEDNRMIGIAISGNCYNMTVHNNVVFSNSTITNDSIMKIYPWAPAIPHDINIYNNVFWAKGSGSKFFHNSSVYNIKYSHNLYNSEVSGNLPIDLPVVGYSNLANVTEDSFAVIGNPLFNLAGGTKSGYHLEPGSPAFNVGKTLTQPTLDFYNNTIGTTSNIGVDQEAGTSTIEYQIDVNHTNSITKPDWTGLIGTEGNAVTISGTRFTMFGGITGTRDRGTAGELTRDFAFKDGIQAGIGVRIENIPPGTYTVNTWHYDPDYPGLVNVEFREKGNSATTQVKATNHSLTSSASTSFTVIIEDNKDYEIIARENSSEDRTRFNGIRLTPVSARPVNAETIVRSEDVIEKAPEKLTVFPNPVVSGFTVSRYIQKDDQLSITISDIQGRIVYSQDQKVSKGNWRLILDKNLLRLERGIYRVTVKSATEKVSTASILVL